MPPGHTARATQRQKQDGAHKLSRARITRNTPNVMPRLLSDTLDIPSQVDPYLLLSWLREVFGYSGLGSYAADPSAQRANFDSFR